MLSYWRFAERYYVSDGKPTKELGCMRDALRPVRRLYGTLPAEAFGPAKLKLIRDYMIDEQDLCRTEINKRTGRIKRFIKWAVSEEMVPPSLGHGLESVTGLSKGRTRARESPAVGPVPNEWVNAVFPYLPPQLIAMIEAQRHTGMRPGEVVIMRPIDIEMSNDVWIYRPEHHKNDWRGHVRAVAMGPRTQQFLTPFLDRPQASYLFSPTEAREWRIEHRKVTSNKVRKTPVYPSELRAREKAKCLRRKRRASRITESRYSTESYWKALYYAFNKAANEGKSLDRWSPNQLRHARATELRKEFGIEATRVSLGHKRLDATEIYAEKDLMLAIEVARKAG